VRFCNLLGQRPFGMPCATHFRYTTCNGFGSHEDEDEKIPPYRKGKQLGADAGRAVEAPGNLQIQGHSAGERTQRGAGPCGPAHGASQRWHRGRRSNQYCGRFRDSMPSCLRALRPRTKHFRSLSPRDSAGIVKSAGSSFSMMVKASGTVRQLPEKASRRCRG
jgi:hypothetical protein